MTRVNVLILALLVVLAAGVAWVANRPAAALTEDQVAQLLAAPGEPTTDREAITAVVEEVLARQRAAEPPHSVAALDAETLNPMIEDYLIKNPSILQRVSEALQLEMASARDAQVRSALAGLKPALYDDPDHVVLGNPQGDVTLVEMFDYNCGYCRKALPDLATLLAEDPDLRVILKEFPILSQGSVDAARVAVVVGRDKSVDYWQFHEALFSGRGQVDRDAALKAAQQVGLNPVEVGLAMEEPEVEAVLSKSFLIADSLGISGTPTYIIGNEVIPGAVGLDELRQRIANMRKCGETTCPG